MKANTALGFVLSGVSLLVSRRNSGDRRTRLLARGCALAVLLLALVTLGEYVVGWDAGIDQLLFQDAPSAVTAHPGRMSPLTALCFAACGAALLLANGRRRLWLSHLLALAAGRISLQCEGALRDCFLHRDGSPHRSGLRAARVRSSLSGPGGWPDGAHRERRRRGSNGAATPARRRGRAHRSRMAPPPGPACGPLRHGDGPGHRRHHDDPGSVGLRVAERSLTPPPRRDTSESRGGPSDARTAYARRPRFCPRCGGQHECRRHRHLLEPQGRSRLWMDP